MPFLLLFLFTLIGLMNGKIRISNEGVGFSRYIVGMGLPIPGRDPKTFFDFGVFGASSYSCIRIFRVSQSNYFP
jgi:hypothetical protein